MKGSPIIATAITIVVLLSLYSGMRSIILPDSNNANTKKHGHSHKEHDPPQGGHNHSHTGHDDRNLDTEFELYFSSLPKSVKITQPAIQKEVLNITEFNSPEWIGSGILNLEGHFIELQVDIEWQTPNEMNFVQIVVSPDKHASREKTLRGDDNISDIAEFNW